MENKCAKVPLKINQQSVDTPGHTRNLQSGMAAAASHSAADLGVGWYAAIMISQHLAAARVAELADAPDLGSGG